MVSLPGKEVFKEALSFSSSLNFLELALDERTVNLKTANPSKEIDPIGLSCTQEILSTDLLDGWLRSDSLLCGKKHQASSSTLNEYLYRKIIIDMIFCPFIIFSTLK